MITITIEFDPVKVQGNLHKQDLILGDLIKEHMNEILYDNDENQIRATQMILKNKTDVLFHEELVSEHLLKAKEEMKIGPEEMEKIWKEKN